MTFWIKGDRSHSKLRLYKAMVVLLFAALAPYSAGANDLLPQWLDLGDFRRQWFSSHLEAASEKALILPVKGLVYRFTWLRSFHRPIIIRVECTETCRFNAVTLGGAGGSDPGSVADTTQRVLSTKERTQLEALFDQMHFWQGRPDDDVTASDGAMWVLEVAKENTYSAWDATLPLLQPAFKDFSHFCRYLICKSSDLILQ